MKRCSECHFTFEDHEQVCDFDGTELTPYPEPPLASKNVSLSGSPSLLRRLIRSRVSLAVLMLAGVILSALLVGFFDAANQARGDTPSDVESRDPEVVTLVPPAEAPVQRPVQPQGHIEPPPPTSRRGITAAKDSSLVVRRPATTSRPRARVRSSTSIMKQTSAFENAHQKESKVTVIWKKTGSILKKTASILKKPFEP